MDLITLIVISILVLTLVQGINANAERRAADERALLVRLAECTHHQ